MFRRSFRARLGFVGLTPLAVLLIAGCGKPEKPSPPPSAQLLSNQAVLATHWIGKARMAQDTNAAYQMEIWNMPESVRLEQQTLDKLARALPALFGVSSGEGSNVLTRVIRPLLDDLIRAESFMEVRTNNNHPEEFALAIRLSPERFTLWETNIAVLKESLSGPNTATTRSSKSVQFTLAGDWAVLGLGSNAGTLFADFVRCFSTKNLPMAATNGLWVVADADLNWLFRSNSIFPDQYLPSVHLSLAGDGQTVRTRAELTFPNSLEFELEPWQVPTNLIHDPLVSFTAIRGVKSWIESSSVWRGLRVGDAPNQVYSWALGGIPSQSYFAAIWTDSSNRFRILSDSIVQRLDSHVVPNGLGRSSQMTNANGIAWTENPFSQPFLRHESGPVGEIVIGGFSPLSPTGQPIPPTLLPQLTSKTNMIYYDWEITQGRVMGWLYLGQFLRFASGKAQLPTGSAGLEWLQAVGPKLGNAATIVQQIAPTRLTLSRTSSAGFTGIELQGFMDWLESPGFPRGLYTSLSPARVTTPARQKAIVPSSATLTNEATVQPGSNP